MEATPRDYSSISPTARALLLLKGMTAIPFMKEAAQLILSPDPYTPDFNSRDLAMWAGVLHFEDRYWSIDQLLAGLPLRNILELSSGFSFRGLAMMQQPGYYYIDTDLPDIIRLKKQLVAALDSVSTGGTMELLPLNALDEAAFSEVVAHFPAGELAIVNEGLLMYLNTTEKEQLCGIIRRVLEQRGGYWITGDIYIKTDERKMDMQRSKEWKEFYRQHQIQENKFDSFDQAESFFNSMGFVVDQMAVREHTRLTALPRLLDVATEEQLQQMRSVGRARATWRLKLAM